MSQPYNNNTTSQYHQPVPCQYQPNHASQQPFQYAPHPPPNPPPGSSPYGQPPNFPPAFAHHAPTKRCFICNDPSHLANTCPFKKTSSNPSPHDRSSGPHTRSPPATDPDTHVEGDMDTKSEADEVRTFMDDVKKRKRPVQISDFKSFAVAIITELRTQASHEQTGTNHATNSPNKSHSARPTRSRQAVPPPPRSSNSAGGSISSKAACKHLTDVFHKSFKSLSIKELKASLTKCDIDYTENDFKSANKKNALIAKLAAARCQEHIDLMKNDTAQL
jgi:hypothetical protein